MGTLLCCVSEKFRWPKISCIRGGGIITISRRKFCLTVPKNFVREPFCAVFQKICGSENFIHKREREREREGSIKISVNFFVSVPKNATGEPFSLSLMSGIGKV